MKRAVLIRLKQNKKQTLGRLFIFDGLDIEFECCTLELPDKQNQRNISCIPTGTYDVNPRTSERHKKHFIVEDVDNRDYILIHPANYYTQLRGCIAVGYKFYDINKDGECDVTHSRRTMKHLLEAAPCGFNMIILDNA